MRIINLIVLICLVSLQIQGQNITLPQLIDLRGQSVGDVEEFLLSIGWDFLEAEEEGADFGRLFLAYNQSEDSSSAESYLEYLYSDEFETKRIIIQVNILEKYNGYLDAIKSLSSLIDSQVEDGNLVETYQNEVNTFRILSAKSPDNYNEDDSFWVLYILSNEDYDLSYGF